MNKIVIMWRIIDFNKLNKILLLLILFLSMLGDELFFDVGALKMDK